jgi:hypothetical protein
MGRVLRDEQRRMIETGEINFQGTKYMLTEMESSELALLIDTLLTDSKELRRNRGSDRRKMLYLSRLRQAQAKAVRAIIREREEQII